MQERDADRESRVWTVDLSEIQEHSRAINAFLFYLSQQAEQRGATLQFKGLDAPVSLRLTAGR